MAAFLKSKLDGTRMAEGKGWAVPPATWQDGRPSRRLCLPDCGLRLKPWQNPPCFGDEDGDGPADVLLQRMLAAGISRFHPDPLSALAESPSDP